MSDQKLTVKLFGEPIGSLIRDPKGRHHYLVENLSMIPLSLSMPKSKSGEKKTYVYEQCEPYFSGLLPDNPIMLNLLSLCLKKRPSDTFGLLNAMGTDCAGAVQFESDALNLDPQHTPMAAVDCPVLSVQTLENHVKNLDKSPYFLDINTAPVLLSGNQHKLGVVLKEDQIMLPIPPYLSTHILKPVFNNQELIQNEWFCMILAKQLGLPVVHLALRQFGKIIALVIERYDRTQADGMVKAIHQEDFCQALGLLPHQKYQRNKGITLTDCFDLLL